MRGRTPSGDVVKRPALLLAAAVTAGALVGAGAVTLASAATANDTACTTASGTGSTWTTARLKAYDACRFDKLDASVKALTPTPSPTSSVTPSVTPSASPTPTKTPTPTPAPTSASPSPTATVAPAANLLGWQLTKDNVGLAPFGLSCASLPAYTGSLTPAKGARISNVRIAGSLDLSAGDIMIDKSCIQPPVANKRALVSNDICTDECEVKSAGTVTIRDSEFDGDFAPVASIASACAFRGIGTLQRNYMHGMDSGICFFGTGFTLDGVAEQNYVTGLRYNDGAHREAATVRDFRLTQKADRTIRFTNNRLDTEGPGVTGSMFIQPTWVDVANVTLTGNYLEGEGYNLYIEDKGGVYSNVRATNNRFRPTGWGASVVNSGVGWAQWADNYLYDATKPDARGAVVSP